MWEASALSSILKRFVAEDVLADARRFGIGETATLRVAGRRTLPYCSHVVQTLICEKARTS